MSILGNIRPKPEEDASDVDKLVWVLEMTGDLLAALIEDELEEVASVDDGLRESLRAAVEDLSQRQLQEATAAVRDKDLSKDLDDHGLAGLQLDAKISGIAEFLKRLIGQKVPKWLQKLLAYVDIVLESLASVVPPAGAVAEMKNAVECALEYRVEENH